MHCKNCGKLISEKKDANILAFLGFVPKSFCNNCYSSKERGLWRHLLYFPKQPINSRIYKFKLWFLTFFALVFFVIMAISISLLGEFKQVLLLLIIPLFFLLAIVIWFWALHFIAKRKLSKLK